MTGLLVSSVTSANDDSSVLFMQAENPTQSWGSGWASENTLNGFTGDGYIVWRGIDDFRTSEESPPAGINAYDFIVTAPGTYQFNARVQPRVGNAGTASDKDNDGWVKFTSGSPTEGVQGDSAKWTKFYVAAADEAWNNYTRGEQYDPRLFTAIKRDLAAGTHRVLVGGRSARFAIDSIGLSLVAPMLIDTTAMSIPSVLNHISETELTSTPTPTEEPSSADITPLLTAQPSTPTVTEACTASGNTLTAARGKFSQLCTARLLKDCDPLSTGGWLCSTETLGGNASGAKVSATPVTQTQPASDTSTAPVAPSCAAQASTLGQAKAGFAISCSGFTRRDCDRAADGNWMCSSQNIGNNSPVLVSTLENNAAPEVTNEIASPTSPDNAIVSTQPEIVPAESPLPTSSENPSSPPPAQNPIAPTRISSSDLLALHYDNCPDKDDGHAIVTGKAVVDAVGLSNIIVVNGTCGDSIRNLYQPSSVEVLQAVWGDNWLDGFNEQEISVSIAAERWASTLANGDEVWVAEGGPSDFTADVLRRIGELYPSVNRKNVKVVQHSSGGGFNERYTTVAGMNIVKQTAEYITVPDGNNTNNGSADLNQKSSSFVEIARQSRYAIEWEVAFDYLNPVSKLDFSDTVELLYIVNDNETQTVDDFAQRYLR